MTDRQKALKGFYNNATTNSERLVKVFHRSLCGVPDEKIAEDLAAISADIAKLRAMMDEWVKEINSKK